MSQKRKAPTNLGLADTVREVCELGFPLGDDEDFVRRQLDEIGQLIDQVFVVRTHSQARRVRDVFRQKWPQARELFLAHGSDSETIVVGGPPTPGSICIRFVYE